MAVSVRLGLGLGGGGGCRLRLSGEGATKSSVRGMETRCSKVQCTTAQPCTEEEVNVNGVVEGDSQGQSAVSEPCLSVVFCLMRRQR